MKTVDGELRIGALKKRVRVGHSDAERSYPQLVTLDLTLRLDFSACLEAEDLDKTVDYLKVVALVDSMAAEYSWKLVERMAFDFAESILTTFLRVKVATVTVTKHVTGDSLGFSTSVTRSR